MKKRAKSVPPRKESLAQLRARLREAEETLQAIREGKVDAVVVAGKQGEQVYSLSGAETIYRLAAETMAEAALAVSPDGRIIFCNPRLAEFLQLPQESLLGMPITDYVIGEDRDGLAEVMQQAKVGPVHRRMQFAGARGRLLPLQVSASPLKQPEGTGVCIVATDLTEVEDAVRKLERVRLDHEALRDSTERLRNALAGAAVGLAIKTPDGRFAEVNDTFCRIVGYSADELRGFTFQQLVHPDDRAEYVRLAERLEAGEINSFVVESRYVRKDGKPVWVRKSVSQVRDLSGVVQGHIAFVEDISEQKQAEETLRESEQQFRVLIENLESAVALVNEHGAFTIVNPSFLRMFELAEDADILNVNSRDWSQWQVCDGNGVLLVLDEHPVRKAALTGRPVRNQLVAMQAPGSAALKWMLISAEPILDPQGGIRQLICTYHDITTLKRAEETLRESEERYRGLFENMSEGFFLARLIFDEAGRPVDYLHLAVNPALERITGMKREALVNRTRGDALKTNSLWLELFARVVETGRPDKLESVSPDLGRHYAVTAYSLGPDLFACIVEDITERKRAEMESERQLEELQRWQAVMLDREDRVMALKREVNELLRRAGEPIRYSSQAGEEETRGGAGDTETRGRGETE